MLLRYVHTCGAQKACSRVAEPKLLLLTHFQQEEKEQQEKVYGVSAS